MAARKDNKGRALRKGEFQRSSDGRYVYAYNDTFGKRRCIYAKNLLDLREKADQSTQDQRDGINTYMAGNADLNYVFDRYISTKSELRDTTFTNYSYMYDRFVREEFGKMKIGMIKYSDVLYYYYHLINERGLQINTLETINTILHPTFQLAVRDDIIRTNPSAGVMAEIKKKSKLSKGIRHALTKEQQRAFIEYTRKNPVFYKWETLFTFLLGTGCRIGETIGLRWTDIDFINRTIDINHNITYYPNKRENIGSIFKVSFLLKTIAGRRVIPMIDRVFDVLQEEYNYQKENGFSSVEVDGMSGFIFTNRFGNIYNPSAINRAIKRVYEAYNREEILNAAREKREPIIIPHFSCHSLRHTFCSRFCENETNIKVIQTIMGHASIETTMDIYSEVTHDRKKEALIALSNKLDVF